MFSEFQTPEHHHLLDGDEYEQSLAAPDSFLHPETPSSQDMEPDGLTDPSSFPILFSLDSQAPKTTLFFSGSSTIFPTSPVQEIKMEDYFSGNINCLDTIDTHGSSNEPINVSEEPSMQIQENQSEDPEDPGDPEDPPEIPLNNQGHRRENDSNNAHKKMTTFIWKQCLTASERKKFQSQLKTLSTLEDLDPKKQSRYGFTCYLLTIKHLFGENTLLSCYQKFNYEDIKNYFKRFKSQSAKVYFRNLIPIYKLAFRYMIEDDVRKCLETTYASDTFRQVQHRNFGLNYVENYDKKIQNAIYLYNLSLKN